MIAKMVFFVPTLTLFFLLMLRLGFVRNILLFSFFFFVSEFCSSKAMQTNYSLLRNVRIKLISLLFDSAFYFFFLLGLLYRS